VDPIIHKLHVNEASFKSFTEEKLAEVMSASAVFFKIRYIKYGSKRLKISENMKN